jgi:hypothetical protein
MKRKFKQFATIQPISTKQKKYLSPQINEDKKTTTYTNINP